MAAIDPEQVRVHWETLGGLTADTTYTVTVTAHSTMPTEDEVPVLRRVVEDLEQGCEKLRKRLRQDEAELTSVRARLKALEFVDGEVELEETDPVHRAEWVDDEGWVCGDCGGASMDRGLLEGVPCLRD